MRRSRNVRNQPDYVVRSAPFRFRTFHVLDHGRLSVDADCRPTIDGVLEIPMPFLSFPKIADATIRLLDGGAK